MDYIVTQDCHAFAAACADGEIDLLLTDPPYMGIVKDSWDNQWTSVQSYVDWMLRLLTAFMPKMAPHGSVIFFGGIGSHGHRPFQRLMDAIESTDLYQYRNQIVWGKRRAYGKTHDYLFCREEIAWYSVSAERAAVRFNIPLLDVKRGYAGWNAAHPAKSEYKRVTNVWSDIPELMRPERSGQKPIPLMERLVKTHSNAGDLVVDPFCGWGTTGVAALMHGRRFKGCDMLDAVFANKRCLAVVARSAS